MLDIRDMDAFYGDSHILHRISMTVPKSARVAILGRNGAGKTTLLRSVMGDGPIVSGQVSFDGKPLAGLPPFRRARLGLSYVPEDRRIFPVMTASENILLATRAVGATRQTFDVDYALDRFPMLKPLVQRMGDQLSGGQQQMLAVARGLCVKPAALLLDEPTEGLAPIIVEQLSQVIVDACRAENVTLILCEQNIKFARHCTDYVYLLNSGSIVFQGDWSAFDSNPEIKIKYLAV